MEVSDPGQDLARDVDEQRPGGDATGVEGAAVNVLKQDLELPAVLVHVVAVHHGRVRGGAEAGDLTCDLALHRVVVVPVEHLERIKTPCHTVPHYPDHGTVRHCSIGCLNALKVLYGNHDDVVWGQIAREMAILHTAKHPVVVRCHDMYKRGRELQILLEYMDCGSLDGRRIVAKPFLTDVTHQVSPRASNSAAGFRPWSEKEQG
jgi:hypothetical protein